MADDKPFMFELYRINVVDAARGLFDKGPAIRSDAEIAQIVQNATNPAFDVTLAGKRATYQWGLRDFNTLDSPDGPVLLARLARSVIDLAGAIMTDSGITEGTAETQPPLAQFMTVVFYMKRHLVAAEIVSALFDSSRWHVVLESILENTARGAGFLSSITLENIPEDNEVIKAFRSFDTLTRLRVRLRLPNPDLTRYTKALAEELRRGGIREYLQDMRNPGGLNTQEGALPLASAALAQSGYKSGDVKLQGIKDGRKATVVTGRHAARGEVEGLRDFVRGIGVTAQTKEAKAAVRSILSEMKRIAPGEPSE